MKLMTQKKWQTTAIALAVLTFASPLLARADQAPTATPMSDALKISTDPSPTVIHTEISPLDKKDIVFRMTRTMKVDGTHESLKNEFVDADGKDVVVETAELENGHVVSFHQDQKQAGTSGDIVVKDGHANFSFTRDGKTKTAEEKAGSDFIVTASLLNYVHDHWDDVTKNKKVKFKLGVLDRREAISFEVKKEKESTYDDKPAFVLKMTPTSAFIAMLVDPVYFTVNPEGTKIYMIDGRTPMKYKSGDSWKDFDGHTVYKYE